MFILFQIILGLALLPVLALTGVAATKKTKKVLGTKKQKQEAIQRTEQKQLEDKKAAQKRLDLIASAVKTMAREDILIAESREEVQNRFRDDKHMTEYKLSQELKKLVEKRGVHNWSSSSKKTILDYLPENFRRAAKGELKSPAYRHHREEEFSVGEKKYYSLSTDDIRFVQEQYKKAVREIEAESSSTIQVQTEMSELESIREDHMKVIERVSAARREMKQTGQSMMERELDALITQPEKHRIAS